MGREALTEDDPQSIGSYWLSARLGVGGQGIVYEAYSEAGTRCAVKVLRSEATAGSRSQSRRPFAKEATAAERVASFCTAKVLEYDPEAEPPYMVSEFVNGPDLTGAVDASGPLTGDALLRLATGVATALTAIHSAGVVHRDLKPGNVLLGPDGPRVIDFGIARTHDMSITTTSSMMGTPAYMAPEVLEGGRADDRADVFAWGAVVLFAATGEAPFQGANLGEVVVRVTEHHPDLDPLPAQLRPLVEAALAKDPAERPRSADLLLSLLHADASATAQARGPAPAQGPAPDGDEAPAQGAGAVSVPVWDEAPALLLAGARSAAAVRAPADHPGTVPELGALAESVLAGLDPRGQAFLQEALLRLVVPGEAPDGSQDTVRTATREELLLGHPIDERPAAQAALDALVAAGVLLSDGHTVRPAGAGLLRAWPRLRLWVDGHRAALHVLHRTHAGARAWERGGHQPEDLPRGDALHSALDWAQNAPAAVRPNLLERQYLDAGRAALSRSIRRRRRLRGGIAVLVAVALTAGTVAWQLQRSNDEQQAEAASRDVATAAESMRSSDPRTAKLLSAAAWRLSPTREARAALYGTSWQQQSDSFTDPSPAGNSSVPMQSALTSDDGSTLVSFTGDADPGGGAGRTYRWDLRTGKALPASKRLPGIPADMESPWQVISPDGRYAAYFSLQRQKGTVRELKTGRKLTDQAPGIPYALSKDGRYVLGGSEQQLSVYDTEKETTVAQVPFQEGPTAFSDDGSVLATCGEDKAPVVYRLGTGEKRAMQNGACSPINDDEENHVPAALDLSPDGKRLVLDNGEWISQWDTSTGRPLAGGRWGERPDRDPATDPTPRRNQNAQYVEEQEDATFYGADGHTLIQVYDDTVYVTDSSAPDRPLFRAPVSGNPASVSFDADRRQLRVLTSKGKTLSYHVPRVPSRLRSASLQGLFSPDARTLLSGDENAKTDDAGDVRTHPWDVRRERRRAQPTPAAREQPAHEATDERRWRDRVAAFSPDGREVSYYTDERVVRQDVRTGKKHKLPAGPAARGAASSLAYGPEGRVLAVGYTESTPGAVDIWREGSGKPRVLKGLSGAGLAVGGSPGHEVLVTTSGRFVDLRTGEQRKKVFGETSVQDVEFSPDGKTLAVSQEDGWISLWNGDATRRLGTMPSDAVEDTGTQDGEQEAVDGLRFSPDGRTLAAFLGKERFQVFDVADRQALGQAHPGLGSPLVDLAFDGNNTLHLSSRHVRLATVDLDADRLADHICDEAGDGAGLTREQWNQNVPDVPYRTVCD